MLSDAASDCEAREVLAFLRRPSAYPAAPATVSVRETRTSWVFLTPGYVYKLKKRLRDEFVDFRSLEGRRRNADEEVRLNRRLAPDVYLGVLPVVRRGPTLALGGEGVAIDWLVRMRRLDEANFLDALAAADHVPADRVDAIATRLAAFYASAPVLLVGARLHAARLRREILKARATLLEPRFGLSAARLRRIVGAQLRFLEAADDPIGRQATLGRIVEGHGDLRPEHLWLGPDPVVIDCLEFNRDLRCVDPFDELSALALECDRLGIAAVGRRLIEVVSARLGRRPPAALLAFYRSLRSVMRARFALRHLLEPVPRQPEKWPPLARAYLALAEAAALELPPRRPDGLRAHRRHVWRGSDDQPCDLRPAPAPTVRRH